MQAKEQWGVPIQNGPIFSQLLKHLPASLNLNSAVGESVSNDLRG